MTDTQSRSPESVNEDSQVRPRMPFIASLKANRNILSSLPEIIEQWLEKETKIPDESETTKHGCV